MPSNLRDYMNRNNLTSSSRDSQEMRRAYDEDPEFGRPQPSQIQSHHQPPKFAKSKNECSEELTGILQNLDRKQSQLRRVAENHNSSVVKKYIEEYDSLSQQILRHVETTLRDNKERILKEIKDRRAIQLHECKPIRRNIDQLRTEVSSLREGLHRESEYRQYISQIVLKDYEMQLNNIQYEINRVRFPSLDLRIDDKYYSCFKSDLERLIIVRDELTSRIVNDSYSIAPQSVSRHEEINSHANRDQIKRTQANKYK